MAVTADQGFSSLMQTNILKKRQAIFSSFSLCSPIELAKIGEVFDSRHLPWEAKVFRKNAYPAADFLGMVRTDAIHNEAARFRFHHCSQDTDRCCFPCPVGSQKAQHTPGFQ